MAIDSPFGGALRKLHYDLQKEQEPPVSAGRFRAPVTMSVLGIKERPVEFEPNEAGKEFLRDFMLENMRRLEVKPIEDAGPEAAYSSGYYMPLEKEGGSQDPRKRTIYLNKNPELFTLIHEGGHAQDRGLSERLLDEQIGRSKYFSRDGSVDSQTIEDIGDDLRRFMSMTGPRSRLEAETTAQKYAADYLSRKGYSDDEIRAMDAGDLGRYPFSYIKDGFGYREGTSSFRPPTMPDANTYDQSAVDTFRQNLGDLYTTPGYLESKDQITQEALNYLEGNLGRFTEAGNKSPREIYTRTVFDR